MNAPDQHVGIVILALALALIAIFISLLNIFAFLYVGGWPEYASILLKSLMVLWMGGGPIAIFFYWKHKAVSIIVSLLSISTAVWLELC